METDVKCIMADAVFVKYTKSSLSTITVCDRHCTLEGKKDMKGHFVHVFATESNESMTDAAVSKPDKFFHRLYPWRTRTAQHESTFDSSHSHIQFQMAGMMIYEF
jgi:hypothetical protein